MPDQNHSMSDPTEFRHSGALSYFHKTLSFVERRCKTPDLALILNDQFAI